MLRLKEITERPR